MSARSLLARLDPFLISGPIATALSISVFVAMVAGAVGTIRTGRWPFRTLLIAGALLWPLPDHPIQGPVVIGISYLHGVHLADLLSVAAVVVAVLPWRRHHSVAGSHSKLAAAEGDGQRPETRSQER